MNLSKSKKSSVFEIRHQVQELLSDIQADVHCYLAKLDRVNRNHEFGKEGYDQAGVEFRLTFCKKKFSCVKKTKVTDYVFEAVDAGCYELGNLIAGKVFKKTYYILKENGSWLSATKQAVFQILEKEREAYEKKKQQLEVDRLEERKAAREKRQKLAVEKNNVITT